MADVAEVAPPGTSITDPSTETFPLVGFVVVCVEYDDEEQASYTVVAVDGRRIIVECDDYQECCEVPSVSGDAIPPGTILTKLVVVLNADDAAEYSGEIELHAKDGPVYTIVCQNNHNGYYPREFCVNLDEETLASFIM